MYSIEDCYGNEVASGVRPCDSTKVTLYVPDAQLWRHGRAQPVHRDRPPAEEQRDL